jgi:hypothetical protein
VLRTTGELEPYSLETLAAQIGHAVDATGAERLVLDSLNAVLSLHADGPGSPGQLLRSLISTLRGMGLTIVLTVETPGDPGGRCPATASRSSSPTASCCCATSARAPSAGAPSRC